MARWSQNALNRSWRAAVSFGVRTPRIGGRARLRDRIAKALKPRGRRQAPRVASSDRNRCRQSVKSGCDLSWYAKTVVAMTAAAWAETRSWRNDHLERDPRRGGDSRNSGELREAADQLVRTRLTDDGMARVARSVCATHARCRRRDISSQRTPESAVGGRARARIRAS